MQKILKIFILSIVITTIFNINVTSYAEDMPEKIYYINKNLDLIPQDKKANRKVILITIDDGPSNQSKEILNTLLKHKAPAIFFINGNHHKEYPENINIEFKAGFTIGNHTWSHPNLKKLSLDKAKKEISSNTELIEKITGAKPTFFRPPYGVITPEIKNMVKKDGMLSMNWSGAAKDWEKSTKDKKVFMKNVLDSLHSGEILLLHEHPWTAKYLDELLVEIESRGYTFADPKKIIY